MHLEEMEVVKAGHDGDGGSESKDIHMEKVNISFGGHYLITDASVTFSFQIHYRLAGRNGAGKTSFLRHMTMHAIDGIFRNC